MPRTSRKIGLPEIYGDGIVRRRCSPESVTTTVDVSCFLLSVDCRLMLVLADDHLDHRLKRGQRSWWVYARVGWCLEIERFLSDFWVDLFPTLSNLHGPDAGRWVACLSRILQSGSMLNNLFYFFILFFLILNLIPSESIRAWFRLFCELAFTNPEQVRSCYNRLTGMVLLSG